ERAGEDIVEPRDAARNSEKTYAQDGVHHRSAEVLEHVDSGCFEGIAQPLPVLECDWEQGLEPMLLHEIRKWQRQLQGHRIWQLEAVVQVRIVLCEDLPVSEERPNELS